MHYIKYKADSRKEWIVYLHGWGLDSSWMIPLAKCNKKTNWIVVDLPGFGKSVINKTYTIDDYVKELHQIIINENINSFIGVGHSFGGKVLGFYAQKYPVGGLCLLSPSIIQNRSIKIKIKILAYKICKKLHLPLKSFFKGSKDYQNAEGVLKETFINIVNSYLTKKDLNNFKIPVVLLGFKKDTAISLKTMKKINNNLFNSKLYVFEGDHLSYRSHIKKINKIILEEIHDDSGY